MFAPSSRALSPPKGESPSALAVFADELDIVRRIGILLSNLFPHAAKLSLGYGQATPLPTIFIREYGEDFCVQAATMAVSPFAQPPVDAFRDFRTVRLGIGSPTIKMISVMVSFCNHPRVRGPAEVGNSGRRCPLPAVAPAICRHVVFSLTLDLTWLR